MALLLVAATATMTMAEQAVDVTPIIINASRAGKGDAFMFCYYVMLLLCCSSVLVVVRQGGGEERCVYEEREGGCTYDW